MWTKTLFQNIQPERYYTRITLEEPIIDIECVFNFLELESITFFILVHYSIIHRLTFAL